MTHIKKTENIEQLNVAGRAIPEVQDLKDDFIGSKEIAEKMIEGIVNAGIRGTKSRGNQEIRKKSKQVGRENKELRRKNKDP
jgi:hypothetical protein